MTSVSRDVGRVPRVADIWSTLPKAFVERHLTTARTVVRARHSAVYSVAMSSAKMTRAEVENYVRSCGENGDPETYEQLVELFSAIFERQPDEGDGD